MVHLARGTLALTAALLLSTAALAEQRVLKYNADYDPIPLAAMEALIRRFRGCEPRHRRAAEQLRPRRLQDGDPQLPTADAPDLANWYAGNRMAPFVEAGQFMDVSDVWESAGLSDALASAKASMTIDGKQWGVPYTYYQWGIYFNKDAYKAAGVEVPKTWDEFVANCEKVQGRWHRLRDHRLQALWPIAGIFYYLSLRTTAMNGTWI